MSKQNMLAVILNTDIEHNFHSAPSRREYMLSKRPTLIKKQKGFDYYEEREFFEKRMASNPAFIVVEVPENTKAVTMEDYQKILAEQAEAEE